MAREELRTADSIVRLRRALARVRALARGGSRCDRLAPHPPPLPSRLFALLALAVARRQPQCPEAVGWPRTPSSGGRFNDLDGNARTVCCGIFDPG
jgi:hypothetical protein